MVGNKTNMITRQIADAAHDLRYALEKRIDLRISSSSKIKIYRTALTIPIPKSNVRTALMETFNK